MRELASRTELNDSFTSSVGCSEWADVSKGYDITGEYDDVCAGMHTTTSESVSVAFAHHPHVYCLSFMDGWISFMNCIASSLAIRQATIARNSLCPSVSKTARRMTGWLSKADTYSV
jgi:hypothetical protein